MLCAQRVPFELLPFIFAVGITACSSDETDGGASPDGGETSDAATPDAGVPDSGVAAGCALLGQPLQEGTAPARRGDMAFGFDGECERLFMFFGDRAEPQNCGPAASDFLEDGFTFDVATQQWASIEVVDTGSAPLKRARSSGAWDPVGKRFLLFGGRWRSSNIGAYTYLNDVWSFDPETRTWTELWALGTPGAPRGRMNSILELDPDGNQLLVHAGGQISADFQTFLVDSETWAFDLENRTWRQIATGGVLPTPRIFHTSAFDRSRRRLYVYSGGGEDAFTSPTFFDDLWYLDVATETWTRAQGTTQPAGRIKGEMDYDDDNDRLVLFAGHDDTQLGNENDVWSFDPIGGAWTQELVGDTFNRGPFGVCDFPANFATVDQASPERRESHVFEIHGGRAVMYGGRTDCGLTNDTWVLDLESMTWTQVNNSFNGMTCFRSGRTDCEDPNARKCG